MPKIAMRFEGGAELADALRGLSTRISKQMLREVLTEAAEPMAERASRLAPRRPGEPDMADHIAVMTSRSETGAAVAFGPTKEFFYGLFQEYGTVHNKPHPFLRPSFDEGASKALDTIGAALWRELAGRGISRPTRVSDTPVVESVR